MRLKFESNMKKIIRVTILVIAIVSCIYYKRIYAMENNNINFQNINIEDGLSQSLAEYIYQDSFGYMWIGTNDGLNRYNGNEFKVYKNIKNDKNILLISQIIQGKVPDYYGGIMSSTIRQ